MLFEPSVDDRVELPLAGHALELVDAAVVEVDAGAGDEILDGARDEHLARPGLRGDARADVDGDAGDLVVAELALARVQPGADVEAELAHRVARSRARSGSRARRAVEGREEAVAGRVDLAAADRVRARARTSAWWRSSSSRQRRSPSSDASRWSRRCR